jgi:hypothetical protein
VMSLYKTVGGGAFSGAGSTGMKGFSLSYTM